MNVTPDIAGFVAASRELRRVTGNRVTFSVPSSVTWPDGTRINPDTGEPYDAMVQPTGQPVEITLVVGVITKQASPLRPQADTQFAAAGEMSGVDVILDVDSNDFPLVSEATDFTYGGRSFRLVEWKPPFAIGEQPYRMLCYGQEH